MIYLMVSTFLFISFCYFRTENLSTIRTFIRRTFCTRRGRALNTLIYNYDFMEKDERVNLIEILQALSSSGFQTAFKFFMNLNIKLDMILKRDKSAEIEDFFDDLLHGDKAQVNEDMKYLIKILRSKR